MDSLHCEVRDCADTYRSWPVQHCARKIWTCRGCGPSWKTLNSPGEESTLPVWTSLSSYTAETLCSTTWTKTCSRTPWNVSHARVFSTNTVKHSIKNMKPMNSKKFKKFKRINKKDEPKHNTMIYSCQESRNTARHDVEFTTLCRNGSYSEHAAQRTGISSVPIFLGSSAYFTKRFYFQDQDNKRPRQRYQLEYLVRPPYQTFHHVAVFKWWLF